MYKLPLQILELRIVLNGKSGAEYIKDSQKELMRPSPPRSSVGHRVKQPGVVSAAWNDLREPIIAAVAVAACYAWIIIVPGSDLVLVGETTSTSCS